MAIVCPYCLSNISSSKIRRVCSICGSPMPEDASTKMQLRLGKIPKCKESGCLGLYSKLECDIPGCGHELPGDIMQYSKYMRFALVSHSGGGKTNFITTMLEELKKTRALQFHTSHMNRETLEYHSDNVKQLYDKRKPILPTARGQIYPLQWKIQDIRRRTRNTTPCYSMTIFDGAGEDLSDVDPVVCRYLTGSKMIMLLLDPTHLYGVRSQMTREEIIGAGGDPDEYISRTQTEDFVQGLIDYIKTSTGIPVKRRVKLPVAVVFGKIDTVERLLGYARVLQPSGHSARGAFVESEAQAIHDEIRAFMDACGDNLNGMFDANFTTWKYFGVSSLGAMPKNGQLQEPQPLRILDPLMWNFSMEGIVGKE